MAAKILIFFTSKSVFPIKVFWGSDFESGVKIARFKMMDPIWWPKL